MSSVLDRRSRPIRDLRISVTDRCNFRCTYCMPKEVFGRDFAFLPRDQLLTFEEITRLATAFAAEGVSKVRLTGGEPLLRRNVEQLIAMLAEIDGITDVALTTNGSALAAKAQALKAAGLTRVTVSLDALDDATFEAMNDVGFPVARVLAGIDAAAVAGLTPVKVNMVVKRGVNDHAITQMADGFRDTGHIVRFIEYMDVGTTNGWRMDDVVSVADIVAAIDARWPLEPLAAQLPGRGRLPLPIPGRGRGDRGDRFGNAALLRRLHASAPVRRGQAVHVSVRQRGPRSENPAARHGERRGRD